MLYLYSLFGLRLLSNCSIPGFTPLPVKPPFDVTALLGEIPEWVDPSAPADREALYVSSEIGENGLPSSRVWSLQGGEYFRILYDDGTDCLVDRKGARIWVWWKEQFGLADVIPYLQGQLLGLAQRLRGVTCLHASAILIGDRAIAVTGMAGSGKSSTATAFLQLGFPVLADDVASIFEAGGKFMVQPAHPRIWLRPEMVETLFGSREALPLLAPSWEKRYLDLNTTGPGLPLEAKPLAAIYVLAERASDPQRPMVATAPSRDTLLHLLRNTYMNHLLDPHMRSQEFETLSRLQSMVPVRLVHPHDDVSLISELCGVIRDDLEKL